MVEYKEYEKYESLIRKRGNARKQKKMPIYPEDRYRGRKLNHRTKKNKVRE